MDSGQRGEAAGKVSSVEKFKAASDYLRGEIAAELADGTDRFGAGSVQLLKHHGAYQQHDRDVRRAGKSGKVYSLMVRTKIPGGKLSAAQLLAELDLCDEVGNWTLRITTRQGLQLHGVVKGDLQRTIRRINDIQLSTLAACGDVERNVMCCPAPHEADPVHAQMQALANAVAERFCPRTTAYHELWLTDPDTGTRHLAGGGADGQQVEPLYGPTYLPRKFKTAIGLPGDNCVDLYTNDLGLMAICEDFKIVGYNVLVGGGMGMTPSAKKTFPALARRLGFITPDRVLDVAEAVLKVHRDFSNRGDRKVARLKYVMAEWGEERFRAELERYYGAALPPAQPEDVRAVDDHLGWHEQGDGRWFFGWNIENGRLHDTPQVQLKSALREILTTYRPGIRLTAYQSLLLTDLAEGARGGVEQILGRHGVTSPDTISNVRRWSMACPALPTCGLAVAESERILPGIIDALETEVARLGLSGERFTLRMTGCPNGCTRPYTADIALVGKTVGKYTIRLGGSVLGNRLNFVVFDLVPAAEVVPTLVGVLTHFKQARRAGETLGDFCARVGADPLRAGGH